MISIFVDEYKESLKGRYNIGEITKLNSRIDSLLLSHTFLSKHSQEGQSFKDFILLLTTHLENSLRNISFSFDLEDFILEKSKFIPLSLLMNELIINSSKHYIKNEKNKICIKSIVTSDRCTISYLDHGNFAINNSPETKGLQLINLLSQQLEGGLEIINYGNNKEFKFTIPR
jgi:two-component sensor histidine kinase